LVYVADRAAQLRSVDGRDRPCDARNQGRRGAVTASVHPRHRTTVNESASSMDLTKTYPASVREPMHGIVQLKRTIDKGKALANGTIGEYNYDCPMDKHLFEFLGLDGAELLDVIKSANDDEEISDFVAPYVHAKSDEEIETFNREWLKHAPKPGTPGEAAFLKIRGEVAPNRTDVTNWPDLLDLDEKRPVPQRAAA